MHRPVDLGDLLAGSRCRSSVRLPRFDGQIRTVAAGQGNLLQEARIGSRLQRNDGFRRNNRPVVTRRDGSPMTHPGARTFLQACLLLLIAEQSDHGYNLVARLGKLGCPEAEPATTYRVLRGLEREGLLTSTWTSSACGPARRTYHLTGRGGSELADCGRELRRSQALLAGYLRHLDAIPSVVHRQSTGACDRRCWAEEG